MKELGSNKIIANLTKHANKIAVVLLLIFAAVSLRLAWTDSATFDEVAHIGAAYSYVNQFDYRLNPEHPPLLKLFAGVPLLILNPNFDTAQDFWQTIGTDYPGEYGQWSAGRHLLYEANENADLILWTARAGMVALATLFGLLIFVLGKYLGGAVGGLLALALFILSPGVLGHAHYVTTDIGAAFFILLSLVTFAQFIRHGTWRWALLAGINFGLAQSAKFSALLLIPLFLLLLLIYPIISNLCKVDNLRKMIAIWSKGLVVGLVGIITIWLIYAPFTVTMPTEVLATLAQTRINPDAGTQYQLLQSAVLELNQFDTTRPFATYLQGIAQVLSRVAGGNQITFFGTVTSDAPAGYFPIVYLIKETLPHIGLILLALFTVSIASIKSIIQHLRTQKTKSNQTTTTWICAKFITTHITEITLLLFVAIYATASINGNLAIGYRHLFPIIPIIYLLTAVAIARGLVRLTAEKCNCANRLGIATIALLIFLVVEVVTSYPYYLSYFNQSVGGPTNGWQFVADSNADWGQDLKRLDKWIDNYNTQIAQNKSDKPPITQIRVDYFGGDNPAIRLGDKFIPWWAARSPVQSGWYAISVNTLQESILTPNATTSNSYLWLASHPPIAQIGTSILVYFIDNP